MLVTVPKTAICGIMARNGGKMSPVKARKKVSKVKRISRLKKEADRLWSINVRERDGGRCQVTGCVKTPTFAHHIFPRRHLSTRWDLDNGFTICWGHHIKGHVEHEWLRDEILKFTGLDKYLRIKTKAEIITTSLTEEDLKTIVDTLDNLTWKD